MRRTRLGFMLVLGLTPVLVSGVRPVSAGELTPAAKSIGVRPATSVVPKASASGALLDVAAWRDGADAIDPRVLSLALSATRCATARGAAVDPRTLTIIDYSRASTEPRLWVLDLKARRVLYEELVAHGQRSGDNLATQFSNRPDSHQTSLGLFLTESTYVGRNGYSLRLNGLEPGYNDRARERAIVMHGAPYVNETIGKSLGRLGRSHGCPAVREPIARELIDRVKGGSLVFAYYPDAGWLETSTFLNGCS